MATYDNANGHAPSAADYQGTESPYASVLSQGGDRLYVTGYSWDNTTHSFDIATVAFDTATGLQVWASRRDGPEHLDDTGYDITVSRDGRRIYVAGNEGWCYTLRHPDSVRPAVGQRRHNLL